MFTDAQINEVTQAFFPQDNSATVFSSAESNDWLFIEGFKYHSNIHGYIQ